MGGKGTLGLIIASAFFSFIGGNILMAAEDFEASPAPFQTTPRPFDGEIVRANPPCFVYPAAKNYDAYVVEVSSAPGFPADGTMVLTGPWMLNVPPKAMKPGRYYWRWRPGRPQDGRGLCSATRSFTLPDDAPVVPFPDIEALAEKIAASRPRILVAAPELDDLRARAKEQFGDGWLASVQQFAERMRKKDLLPEPEFLPDHRDPHYKELYVKTFTTTRPFFREMERLAQGYLLAGSQLSGLEAKRRLLHIVSWDPKGSTSIGHNDEPATEVVRFCPRVYDWIYPLLTPDERKRCLECSLIRMRDIYSRWKLRPFEKYPYESHNMGYYLPDLLEASLALAGEAPVEEMLRYTLLQLWSPFYPPYGGQDGGWNEGPNYWRWIASVVSRLYLLVERATGAPIRLRSNLRNQAFYKIYGNPPYFKMSPFGDGQSRPAGGGEAMYEIAALYNNPYAKWYADYLHFRPGGLEGLLFRADDLEAKPPLDLPQGRCFFDVGLACMHTGLPDGRSNVAMLLRSCPFGGISHAYADQNTYTLDAYGEPLIIASGYYGEYYGCPHHVEWTRQTRASNSILVNDKDQPRTWNWDAKGRIASFHTAAAGDYAVGEAHLAYPDILTRYDRRIVFLRPLHTKGEAIIVVHDQIEATEPSTYQFLLHALNKMTVDAERRAVTIRKGKALCRVDFLAPAALGFEQSDKFTKPPADSLPNQWHLTASTVGKTKSCSSAMIFQPCRAGEGGGLMRARLEQGQGCLAVVLTDADRKVIVLFRTDPTAEMVTALGVRTDGEAASVCLVGGVSMGGHGEGGMVESAVVFGGSMIGFDGTVLIQAGSSGGLAVRPTCDAISSTLTVTGLLVDVAADRPGTVSVSAPMNAVRAYDENGAAVPLTPGKPAAIATRQPKQLVTIAIEGISDSAVEAEPLHIEGQRPIAFEEIRHPRLQRTSLRATCAGTPGTYEVVIEAVGANDRPCPITLALGSSNVRDVVRPSETRQIKLPVCSFGAETDLTIGIDSSRGGRVKIISAVARRVYEVNFFPNASFEDVADNAPVGFRAGTITKDARCKIASALGGRTGERCLKVICTKATGGDFGVYISWPGIPAVDADRRFRISCWVKTDADSVAGLQVTSRDWRYWKNTPRLRDKSEWTESALEFTLPAGQELTNARLHASAQKVGAALFMDDVSIVELRQE